MISAASLPFPDLVCFVLGVMRLLIAQFEVQHGHLPRAKGKAKEVACSRNQAGAAALPEHSG